MNVVDSSGWLEFLRDGPNADFFAAPILKLAELIVPTISLYEIFKKVAREEGEGTALRAVAQMKQGRVVAVDEMIALRAARASLRHQLPMADALIYATAQFFGAILWTQDEHFRELPGVKFFGKSATR